MYIASNGSKWMGEKPDTVAELIAVLAREPLDPRFALPKKNATTGDYFYKTNLADSSMAYCAFGNFLNVSHVFRIFGTPREMYDLRNAIAENIRKFKPRNDPPYYTAAKAA